MENKVEIKGKEYTVKEITYMQAIEVQLDLEDGKKDLYIRKLLKFSSDITDEELEGLSIKEGSELQKAVNIVNSMDTTDFQEPSEEKKE